MPPTLRRRLSKKPTPTVISRILRKPYSTDWFDLPAEMRQVIIDEMEPKVRCKFAQFSKLCEIEVKRSKNYLYGVEVVDESEGSSLPQIRLTHCPETPAMDYCFEFMDTRSNQTVVLYRSETNGEKERDIKWIKIERGEPREVRLRYLKEYIDRYKNSIRHLDFDTDSPDIDFDAKHLKKLEKIFCTKDVIKLGYFSWQQILNANTVFLPETKLTFEEVMQLNGPDCIIQSGEFDEAAISKYLKMRENGEVHKNMKELTIYYGARTKRNYGAIKEGLNVFNYKENDHSCQFRFKAKDHPKDDCNFSVLYNYRLFEISMY